MQLVVAKSFLGLSTRLLSNHRLVFPTSHSYGKTFFRRSKINSSQGGWDEPAKRSPLISDERCPVPLSQQPINEYNTLKDSDFFSWVSLTPSSFATKLAVVGVVISIFLGWPVASLTFNQKREFIQTIIATLAAGQAAVTLTTLRLYLGWSFVGDRLFSATVEYEESGWYDGQVWVKTPELLMRDRLLATYKVKPIINRLKKTLVGLAASLLLSTLLILYIPVEQPPINKLLNDSTFEDSYSTNAYMSNSMDLYEMEGIEEEEIYSIVHDYNS